MLQAGAEGGGERFEDRPGPRDVSGGEAGKRALEVRGEGVVVEEVRGDEDGGGGAGARGGVCLWLCGGERGGERVRLRWRIGSVSLRFWVEGK